MSEREGPLICNALSNPIKELVTSTWTASDDETAAVVGILAPDIFTSPTKSHDATVKIPTVDGENAVSVATAPSHQEKDTGAAKAL